MGIYNNGEIYGIKIYTFNNDDLSVDLFEKKYREIMNDDQKKEAYLFYTNMASKNKISFQIYTRCSSTHDINNNGTFMMWYPFSLNQFIEEFGY